MGFDISFHFSSLTKETDWSHQPQIIKNKFQCNKKRNLSVSFMVQ